MKFLISLFVLVSSAIASAAPREIDVIACQERTVIESRKSGYKTIDREHVLRMQYSDGDEGTRSGIGAATDSQGNRVSVLHVIRGGSLHGFHFKAVSNNQRVELARFRLPQPSSFGISYTPVFGENLKIFTSLSCELR